MQLNLSKFLELDSISANCVLFSASEESTPLIMSLCELLSAKLSVNYFRQAFMVDRFFDLQIIKDILSSASLFGDRNLIELNFKTKPSLEQQKQLLPLFELLDENNTLLILCDKLDKKDLGSLWVQSVSDSGIVLMLNGDYADSMVWSKFLFKQKDFMIESAALELLLGMNQNNYAQLFQEINRLCLLFSSPYQISLADVKSNVVDNAQFNVFALANAYLTGNLAAATKIFHNICSSTEDAILIVWNLGEDLRKLIRIKGVLKTVASFSQAIEGLRIWGESVPAFKEANGRLSYQQVLGFFDELALVDRMLKGIVAGDPLRKLEWIIISVCKGT